MGSKSNFLQMTKNRLLTTLVCTGIVPTIKSCGRQNFTGLTKAESCELLVQNNTGCIPDLTADFASVGYEVRILRN